MTNGKKTGDRNKSTGLETTVKNFENGCRGWGSQPETCKRAPAECNPIQRLILPCQHSKYPQIFQADGELGEMVSSGTAKIRGLDGTTYSLMCFYLQRVI